MCVYECESSIHPLTHLPLPISHLSYLKTMSAIDKIVEKASALNGTVVLPEGMDARVVTAACACVDRKICTPVVLGTAEEIAAAEEKAGMKLSDRGIKVIDYTQGDAELENAYLEAWNAKESKKPAEKQKI